MSSICALKSQASKQDPGPCGGVGVQDGATVFEEGADHITAAKLKPAEISFPCALTGRSYIYYCKYENIKKKHI